MTLRQRVRDLKEALQTEDDFSVIASKFFEIAHDREFIAIGKHRENEFIDTLVEHTIRKVFGEDKAFLLRLEYVKKFNFYHFTAKHSDESH
jgi:hypothetical protein